MKRLSFLAGLAACSVMALFASSGVSAQTVVATYKFNNSLAAEEAGKPALVAIDPLAGNSFVTDTVFGSSQQVYKWHGNAANTAEHAGFSVDTTGLLSYDNYSVEMIFKFSEHAQAGGGWRRIIDTQNRTSDIGFYVDPGDHLQVYPVVTGPDVFSTGDYHHVVLSNYVVGGTKEVKAYLDGVLQLTSNTDQLNLDNISNPNHLLHFFTDNFGAAPLEFADGSIAFLRLYDGIIVPQDPGRVPEPGSIALLCGAAMGIGVVVRRRK